MEKQDSLTMEDVKHGDIESNGGGADLRRMETNYTITAEQFERLYLSPKGRTTGDLSKMFGNPTPVAITGFVMALTPLSIAFMGWRGSGGNGVATTGATLFFGALLLVLAGLLEFVLGNTFPSLVFLSYGAHFGTFGVTFIPSFNAVAAFDTDGSQMLTPEFLNSFAFYNIMMGVLSFFFLIASVRTNLIFLLVFLCASLGFFLATGAFFMLAAGQTAFGTTLIIATGASFFTCCMFGWYLLLAILLAVMDLPSLPVFDLSNKVKGMSERKKTKEDSHQA